MAAVSFARRWADGYRISWEAGDAAAAAALYRDDCVFRSAPFRDPEPPIDYTTRVYPEARAEDVRFGEPVEAGDRAAVEWWATLVLPDGEEQAIAGCSMLRFDEQGLVVESRDYWHMEPGRREPHATWGQVRLGRSAALTAAVAVAFADSSIVVLALPELYGRFNTTIEGVSWVVTAYNAAVAVIALLLLLLVHRFARRCCWVRARALPRGLDRVRGGAEPRVPDRGPDRPRRRRGAAAGGALPVLGRARWTAAATFGLALGPALGGVLTQAFDWRAIFVAQAPVAALGLVGLVRAHAHVDAEEGWSCSLVRTLPANACLGLLFGALWGRCSWPCCS